MKQKIQVFTPDEWAAKPLWLRITILWAFIFPISLVLLIVMLPFVAPVTMAKLLWEDTQKEIARDQEATSCVAA